MVDDMPRFKILACLFIKHHAIHDEKDELNRTAGLGDLVARVELVDHQVLHVLGVKVVVSVLEELVDQDGVLIHEFGHVHLHVRGKGLEDYRHFLVSFQLVLRAVSLKKFLQLEGKVASQVELAVQLLDLMDLLGVYLVCPGYFTEFGT